ncbi:MAG: prepilin-type N-terminal cleavage/methylation domain-containing protein [Candidatus Levybacteria bacterium]|nr:prepilin-type N-terminal cleavage/methylation domain-containing protein [Candidatus Levybacteria bacterium]
MKITFNHKGQTMIEALIALSIILTIMSATTVAVVTSLNNANFIKEQTQANKLAQEGMEYLRYQITNNIQVGSNDAFATYSTYNNAYGRCMTPSFTMTTWAPSTFICPASELIEGKFSRTVRFTTTQCDTSGAVFTNGLRAIVTVYWRDGKCTSSSYCHSQEVTSCFTNPSTTSPTGAGGNTGI